MCVTFEPSSPEFFANPYPTYTRLREEAPIFYYEPWDRWILSRYEDINSLLRDKRLGRVIHHLLPPEDLPETNPKHAAFHDIQKGSLLEIEPPDHTRIRAIVHNVFTPKHVRALSEKIELLCERLVDGLEKHPQRQGDLIKDFAEPIPVTVIADLLGVPEVDRLQLLPWSKAIIGMFEPERSSEIEQQAVQAAAEFSDYIRSLMKQKRKLPREDLISRFVSVHDQNPDMLSEGEVIANCILFLNAGHEAVVNVIGNGIFALLRHHDQLELLRNDLSLCKTAIEEMMRFDTPLQFFERFVLEDMTYKSFDFKKGTKLALFYASANHDPDIFDKPEIFDIKRDPNPHIAFGLGLHYCIGAPLARLELQTALRVLLTRLPRLRLASQTLTYHPKNVFHYLTKLPVHY